MKHLLTSIFTVCAVFLMTTQPGHAAAIETASLSGTLAPGDDGTTGDVAIGFAINFGGISYSNVSVNTNGNLSLGDGGFGRGTPGDLSGSGRVLIAPFWADVDTRGSGAVQYGAANIAGRSAFAVTYSNVGFYQANSSKTNSFQVILFNRADTGTGNFDVEFNYDKIQWESGADSGGVNGLGGTTAVAGLTSGAATTQLLGSLVPGAFVDGGSNSLVSNSLNARGGVSGRYDFNVRAGNVVNPVPEPASFCLLGAGGLLVAGIARRRKA